MKFKVKKRITVEEDIDTLTAATVINLFNICDTEAMLVLAVDNNLLNTLLKNHKDIIFVGKNAIKYIPILV